MTIPIIPIPSEGKAVEKSWTGGGLVAVYGNRVAWREIVASR